MEIIKAKQEQKDEMEYEYGESHEVHRQGKKKKNWVKKESSGEGWESDGYRSRHSSDAKDSENATQMEILSGKAGTEVSYMGCTTWKPFRQKCAEEAWKKENIFQGKQPCFARIAPGRWWASKKQDWSEAEGSLTQHIRAAGENEEQ